MAGNPRENVRGKGFWDGGDIGHGTNKETAGRPSGLPGTRKLRRIGINTDIEFPPDHPSKEHEPKA